VIEQNGYFSGQKHAPLRERFKYVNKLPAFLLVAFLGVLACKTAAPSTLPAALPAAPTAQKEENPPAPGFDAAGSDAKAIALADAAMRAMGGRAAWDAAQQVSWTFFGVRTHVWDKHRDMARIEWLKRPLKVIVHLRDGTGKVLLDGVEQTHPDSLAKYLDMGKKAWVNDSYWLAMPYKLKDSGVTLKYVGEGETADKRAADVLQLTFKGVGVTPDNKYHVWVDKELSLVTQWAFFKTFTDEKPQFTNPWGDYKQYGLIRLSGSRGRGTMDPIQVTTGASAEPFTKW
jgi:hypothetical protein